MLRKHAQDGRRTQRARPQLLRRRGTSALAAQTMCHRGERAGASPGGSMWHRVRRARGQLGRRGACALAAPMVRQRGGNDAPCACRCAWHPGSARRHGQRLGQQNPCVRRTARRMLWQAVHEAQEGNGGRRADGASARGGGSARRDWPWAGHGEQESTCACARREALLVAKRARDRSRRGLSQREHFTRYK